MNFPHIETKAELNQILARHQEVLLDFYAPWCDNCKRIEPELETVAREFSDSLAIVCVNTDKPSELEKEYEISGIPVLVLFQNGKQVFRAEGYRDARVLSKLIERSRMMTRS